MASAKINPDLTRERSRATFKREHLTYALDGGKEVTERRHQIANLVYNDKDYKKVKDSRFLSASEYYEQNLQKGNLFRKKTEELGLSDPKDLSTYMVAVQGSFEFMPFALHERGFIASITSLCSKEQLKKWLPLASSCAILGTYAQTELGHGTNIRKLETTATYDPKSEEFIIHSPTLSSIKFWPGFLGRTSTHVICVAQLYTLEKCYGIHPFIVQIRSTKDHSILPGIEVGDIGPKMGFTPVDNGYLKFDHVRIPRENMLMKNAQVLVDGTYIKPPRQQLSYAPMVYVRALIVRDSAGALARAVTIAVRYSAVRRQSEIEPNGLEPQVIDFVTQQYKLFPLLATAYAFYFVAQRMISTYETITAQIYEGNLDQMPELHSLACSLKSLCSDVASKGIEQCRMSCGGHGYSKASALPDIYTKQVPACTFEGDNTVLMLQAARYLVKHFNAAKTGAEAPLSVAYLSRQLPPRFQFDRRGRHSPIFAYRARRLVSNAADLLKKQTERGVSYPRAWNNCSVDLLGAVKAHSEYIVVRTFEDALDRKDIDEPTRDVLSTLYQLYCMYTIEQAAGDFLEDGYMNGTQLAQVKQYVVELLAEVRPNAVTLVDAFDFHDEFLSSALGAYDGNVYERLFEYAKKSTLNETNIHPSYYTYLKPMMEEARSKL